MNMTWTRRVALLVASLTAAALAGVELTVQSTPSLPLPNWVENPGFEGAAMAPWRPMDGHAAAVALDEASAASGARCLRVVSAPNQSPGAYQRLQFPSPLPAGTPLYFRMAAKKTDADLDAAPARAALQLRYDDGTSAYQPVPELPVEDYDWLTVEKVITLAKPVSAGGTLYLCHYKQEGTQWFDDLVLVAGKVQLAVAATARGAVGLERVRVWSGQHGLEYDSGTLAGSPKEFSKVFDLPGYATYYVEVIDASGAVTGKVYPENGEVNVPASAGVIPLTALKRLVLKYGSPATMTITLPELAGRRVCLALSARLHHARLAGHTSGMLIKVNGKQLGARELVKPSDRLMTASGREGRFATNRGYVTYYSPAFFSLSTDNGYCPVSEPDRNPFLYRLDISPHVQAGANTVEISCPATSPRGELFLIIEQARVVLE